MLTLPPNSPTATTATKSQPEQHPTQKTKDGRQSVGKRRATTKSQARRHSQPKGRAVGKGRTPSSSEAVAQEKNHQHPTGRETRRLGKGTAREALAARALALPFHCLSAPHPIVTLRTPPTDAQGRPQERLRAFPLSYPPPKAFPPSSGPENGDTVNVRSWQTSNTPPTLDSQTNKKA